MLENSVLNEEQEERLAVVLDELVQQSSDGASMVSLNLAIASHPDLEAELRELYATAMIASDVAMLGEYDLARYAKAAGAEVGDLPGLLQSDVGATIADYQLLEEIGRGGMGVVYRAHQKTLNRTVALKMIPNAAFASSQDLARLRAEALAAAGLSHPSIVPVYEVGEFNGQPWFSMQYVKGTTLTDKLVSGPMQAEAAIKLLLPIIDAIGVAHQAGVLHRDLKPSNILLSEKGEPFITDFGLAKRLPSPDDSLLIDGSNIEDNLTASGAILGTPSWMSPEQAAGDAESINSTSDVYSLGGIMYAMLTGRPPFQAVTPFDTLLMVMEQDPISIRVLNARVDSDLEMVVMKCLQKPQDLRYSDTTALADDLRAWLAGEPVAARQSTIINVMTRIFRESHHVSVLQNWGLLWMWHSLVLLALCLITNAFQFAKVDSRLPYVGLWVIGLSSWAFVFWNLRRRSGPITFVERQIAHVWAGSMLASSALFWVESLLGEPVLTLSPVLGCIAGIVFLAKAGMLSGIFYLHSAALFLGSILMAAMDSYFGRPNFSISLFGVISGLTFFLPGLKYYRLQRRS
ncbi:MAG: serine/threonine-protein kinase [Fuerstiella sp.]